MAFAEEEQRHELKGESQVKAEALEWLEIKAHGLIGGSPEQKESGALALSEVLNKEKKQKTTSENTGGQTSANHSPSPAKQKDEQVVEADALSDIGNKKAEAQTRVSRMLKLAKAVQKDLGPKAKSLDKAVAALQELDKKGKKVSLEKAKSVLFDAALEIKKAKASK